MVEITPRGKAKPPETVKLADNVYRYGPQPRQKAVAINSSEVQPRNDLPQPERPPIEENPLMAAEPVTLTDRPFDRRPHWRDKLAVRRMTDADLYDVWEWAYPRIAEIHPRCTEEGIWPTVRAALGENRCFFVRTENAVGLYIAETTPWEPLPTVYGVFLVGRTREDDVEGDRGADGQFRTSLAAGLQPIAILEAAYKWACDIKAFQFLFGTETKYDVSKFAERIGYDHATHGFCKLIKKE